MLGFLKRRQSLKGVQGVLPKQTAAELRRFRAAVDTCVDAIYVVDRETLKFVDATATASSSTGYSHEELIKLGPLDLLKVGREELIRTYDEAIAAGGRCIRSESKGRHKDGRESFVELTRQAVRIDGRWYIVTISRDVTERKLAERRGRHVAAIFAALSETNEAIMRAASPEDLYRNVCEAAVRDDRLLAASICVPAESPAGAQIVAMAGSAAQELRDVHVELFGTAMRLCAPCISNDFRNDARMAHWHEAAQKSGMTSGAALPLIQHGRAIGALVLYSPYKNAFDEEVVQLLMHMGRNVVFALDNMKRESGRKLAEDQLRSADARLKRATRGANDGLWEMDVTTRDIWVSEHFAEMLGFEPHEFASNRQQFFDILHPEDSARLRDAMERSIRDDVLVDMEVRARTRSGEQRWYRIRGALERDASGTASTVSGSQRDITQRQQYALALLEATETAAAASKAKSQFLANMSHEIRTPMNGVIGMIELLLETPLNPMQLDYAETVRDSAAALLTVINDILDFSKVEAGKLDLELLDMDMRDTVEDVARLLAIQAHAKGLEVIALIDPGLPDLVRGDAVEGGDIAFRLAHRLGERRDHFGVGIVDQIFKIVDGPGHGLVAGGDRQADAETA